ncbi:hypothetical protein [Thermococcus sp.]
MEYKIVNIVVSGHLGSQINLEKLLELDNFSYDPEYYHGGYLRLSNGLSVTIYRTGKYIIPGVKRLEDIESSFDEMIRYLSKFIDVSNAEKPKIRNLVISGKLEEKLSLEELAIKLPNVEYDPEQFPGLILKFNRSLTVLLFNSGRFVVVGAKSLEEAKNAIKKLKELLKS